MTMEFEKRMESANAVREVRCQGVLVSRHVTQDGMTVRIEAELSGQQGWILRVIGRHDQVSEWMELFASSADAVTTALSAIRYEGIEEFYDDPIFDYLQNSRRH